MAESQVPFPYDVESRAAIRAGLSEPRFIAYLDRAGGDESHAIELYLFNSRLAKSFLFPLNVVEIVVRNAVDQTLARIAGTSDWHKDRDFIDKTFSSRSNEALQKAIVRAGEQSDKNKLVAELTFDFWSNIFRREYASVWRTKINIAFPNLQRGEGRDNIQKLVCKINRFRNRVAHHEPILSENPPDMLSAIAKLIDLRCQTTAQWMRHHATVDKIIRTRPTPQGRAIQDLASRLDKNFRAVWMVSHEVV